MWFSFLKNVMIQCWFLTTISISWRFRNTEKRMTLSFFLDFSSFNLKRLALQWFPMYSNRWKFHSNFRMGNCHSNGIEGPKIDFRLLHAMSYQTSSFIRWRCEDDHENERHTIRKSINSSAKERYITTHYTTWHEIHVVNFKLEKAT